MLLAVSALGVAENGRVGFSPEKECRMRGIRSIFASPSSRRAHGASWIRRIGIAGFTILEMYIVIEIIGLLTTIVISNYYKSKKAAEVAVVVENLRNVQVALTSYFAEENKFPASLNTIWLQFYNGRVVDDFSYCTAGGGAGWDFFVSNSPDIRFNGPGPDEYAIKSNKSLLPYALYVYGDAATGAKVVH
jgi:type II secretory pathway pseudopilin PulG